MPYINSGHFDVNLYWPVFISLSNILSFCKMLLLYTGHEFHLFVKIKLLWYHEIWQSVLRYEIWQSVLR